MMNIGAGKFGDSLNHAQHVGAAGVFSRPVQPVDNLLYRLYLNKYCSGVARPFLRLEALFLTFSLKLALKHWC